MVFRQKCSWVSSLSYDEDRTKESIPTSSLVENDLLQHSYHKRDSVDSDRCYETTICRLSDAESNLARAWRESTTEIFYGLSCGNLGTTKTPICEKKKDTASMLNIFMVDLIWRGVAGYGAFGYERHSIAAVSDPPGAL